MQRVMALFFAVSAILLAQDGPRLSFEVASVKAAPEDANGSGWGSTGMAPRIEPHATRITFTSVSLIGILCRAYDLMPPSIHAPEGMGQRRYSISAKVAPTSPEGHIPEMLQTLLADRFQMKLHWDTKEESGYSLTVTKGGPKLKESVSNTTHATSMRGNGHLEWTAYTMSDLSAALTVLMGSAVVNTTNLLGVYDISIDAAPDSMPAFRFGGGQDSSFPTIFDALRQLGLNLAPGRVKVKHLVVDSALKAPTDN